MSLPAAGACVSEHGWGGARARAKEAASPFFPAAFSNLSRATPCGEGRGGGRIAEKAPCRTPATLAVDSIVVDWTGSLELERVVVSLLRVFFLSFTFFFFLEREKRVLAMIQFPLSLSSFFTLRDLKNSCCYSFSLSISVRSSFTFNRRSTCMQKS